MRAREFISDDQKLDEILPLIGAAAGAVARGAGALAGRAAMGLGKAALRGAGSLAKGAVTSLAKGAMSGDDDQADPNATVGTQSSTLSPKTKLQSSNVTKTTADKAATTLANLRPGTNIQMPTNTGRVGNFKVTRVTPNDVEIENPDKLRNPTEPDKVIFNKKDLAKAMGVQ